MRREEAKQLIEKTFNDAFDEHRFRYFIKNLLNELDETKAFEYHGNYIRDAFKDYVRQYKRLGQYVDPEGHTLDVLVVELKRASSLERARTMQRNFVAWYLDHRDQKNAALVAYYTPESEDWRFSYVRMNYATERDADGKIKVKKELTPARRYSFLVGKNEPNHTPQQQMFPILLDDRHNPTLAQIEDAFSIEKVTREFFQKYKELFLLLKDALDEIVERDARIKQEFESKQIDTANFAKKLLGQIVFLYFLQKKGWLGVGKDEQGNFLPWGRGPKNFLQKLLRKEIVPYDNFFNDILEPLFYEALANERENDYYSRFNCKIPFLNGGLFEPIGGYDWQQTDILIEDDIFRQIFETFDLYNFTVREDEPLEKEVAVDPEMLGKVFENPLEIKDRKSKGAYYTPREIVHYMCQESLINYLDTALNPKATTVVPRQDIEFFIRRGEQAIEHDRRVEAEGRETRDYPYQMPESIRKHARKIDAALADIKICDPAIGSGAFPVGMMQEIVKARLILNNYPPFNSPLSKGGAEGRAERTAYNFKRHCIQENLYGVDIDPGAVDIAKLRLWLSLVVDEDDYYTIKPLPNLDYKIVCGNSLLGVEKDLFNQNLFAELETLKPKYFEATHPGRKRELKRQIDALVRQITHNDTHFDFEVYFSEVFHHKGTHSTGSGQGFDVVIANPPYVRADSGEEYLSFREKLEKSRMYKTLYEKWDLFIPFIERGLNILNIRGSLMFITSDALCTSKYAHKLLDMILGKYSVYSIDYFENIEVFDAGVTPIVLHIGKNKEVIYTKKTIREKNFQMIKHYQQIPATEFKKLGRDAFRKDYVPLILKVETQKLGEICYVSYGLRPNSDERFWKGEFKTKDVVSTKKDQVHCKPFIEGKDIEAYRIKRIRYLEWGTNRVPAKISRPTFSELYTPPKIIRGRMNPAVCDDIGIICSANAIVLKRFCDLKGVDNRSIMNYLRDINKSRRNLEITSSNYDLKYLLAILNSKFAFFYLNNIRRHKMKNYFYPDDLKRLPIKKISSEQQKPFIEKVDQILAIKAESPNADIAELEREIDQLIYRLYGLTEDEIKIIEDYHATR